MADKKNVLTPFGDLKWCFVDGQGKLNFEEDGYEFTATVVLSKKDGKSLAKEIDDFAEDNAPNGLKYSSPYKIDEDGNYQFNFKTKTEFEGKDGSVRKQNIKLKDSQGQLVELPDGIGIGEGSKGRISGVLVLWTRKREYGVYMGLKTVQLTEFVPYEGDDDGIRADDDVQGSFKGFDNDLKKKKGKVETTETDEEPKKKKKKKKKNTDAE